MINEMTQKTKFATRGEIKSRCSQKKKPVSFIKRYKWKCTVAASRVEHFIWQRSYQPINILWSGCLRSRKPSAYLPSRCVSAAPEKISFMRKPWGFFSQASLFLYGKKRPPVMWSRTVNTSPLVAGCRIGHKSFLLCVTCWISHLFALESHHNIL